MSSSSPILAVKPYTTRLAEGFPYAATNTFASVDAARGLAASIVLIHHLTVFFPSAITKLFGQGTTAARSIELLSALNTEAVMLFFVISGFCIRSSSQKLDFRHWNDALYYGRRRFARIVPLYWLALAFAGLIGVILKLSGDHAYSLATLIGNLGFLQTSEAAKGVWFVPYGQNGPLWSISYEAFYYALFPVALLLERRCRIESATSSLAVAYGFSTVAFVAYELSPNPITLFAIYFCVWRLGVCAFDVLQNSRDRNWSMGFIVVAAGILSLVIAWHTSANLTNIRNGTVIAALWIALQSWPAAQSISTLLPISKLISYFARIGAISYGLYLLHYPLLRLTSTSLGDSVGSFAVAVLAAFILAAIAEAGGRQVKHLLLRQRTTPACT
jgi:peptidoglycan/LPS O-acetylase OafA/YrhL